MVNIPMKCKCEHTKWMHVNSNNGKYVYSCKSKSCDCKQFIPEKITTNYDKDDVKYLKTKGCGKEFVWIEYLKDKRICGQIEDLKHSDHIILCPSCTPHENCKCEICNYSRLMDELPQKEKNSHRLKLDKEPEDDSNQSLTSGSEFNFFEDIIECLERQFPKGECKERGNALVLFAVVDLKFKEFIKKEYDLICDLLIGKINAYEFWEERGKLLGKDLI